MNIETFCYSKDSGWSVKKFPELDSANTVLFIFGDRSFFDEKAVLLELLASYPNSHPVGCSTAGEVLEDRVLEKSLSVAVVRFDKTQIRSAKIKVETPDDSFAAGKKLAEDLNAQNLAGVFVLSDGLLTNGTQLTKGFQSVLSQNIPVTGGLAGDSAKFERTAVVGSHRELGSYVRAVGFYGKDVLFAHGSQGGWDMFGPERHVTKSKGNVLYELDGKPALDLYKEYLGDKASELPASALLFPLAIRTEEDQQHQIVRTILGVDEEQRSLIFAGDIPQGCRAQLMRANFDRLIDGAFRAASSLKDMSQVLTPILSIAISCVGRKLVLGQRIEEEVDATLSVFPNNNVHQIGYYSYGEISPHQKGEACQLHNQTMTITAISEK